MKATLYEQIGTNYRFFLNWRHASFAGYMVLMGATAALSIDAYNDAKPFCWLVPLAGAPFGVFFAIVDTRIQAVFQCAIEAGRKMEGELGGYFSEQSTIGTVPRKDKIYPRFVSHTAALRTIYLGSSLVLAALGVYLLLIT